MANDGNIWSPYVAPSRQGPTRIPVLRRISKMSCFLQMAMMFFGPQKCWLSKPHLAHFIVFISKLKAKMWYNLYIIYKSTHSFEQDSMTITGPTGPLQASVRSPDRICCQDIALLVCCQKRSCEGSIVGWFQCRTTSWNRRFNHLGCFLETCRNWLPHIPRETNTYKNIG